MAKGRLEHAQYLIDKAISIEDREEYQDTRREIAERKKDRVNRNLP